MYVFDTDTLSELVKPAPSSSLLVHLARVARQDQFTTAITVGEMFYGAYNNPERRESILSRFEEKVWPRVRILPFDTDASRTYGQLRAHLERIGTPLPGADLQIASIALTRGYTVVTGNVRHFARVPGLRVENWI